MTNSAVVHSDWGDKRPFWEFKRPSYGTTLSNRETLSSFDFYQNPGQILHVFNRLIALPPDWDSYGARRIDILSAAAAFQVLMDVMREDTPIPSIVPTSDGHVQFEWHMKGIDLEVEVISPTTIHVLYEDLYSGEPPQDLTLSYDLTSLNGFVGELTQRA